MLQILLVTNEICLHKGLSRGKKPWGSCLRLCCMSVICWDRFSKGKITLVLRYFLISWLLSRHRSLSNFSSKQIFTESRNWDFVFSDFYPFNCLCLLFVFLWKYTQTKKKCFKEMHFSMRAAHGKWVHPPKQREGLIDIVQTLGYTQNQGFSIIYKLHDGWV